MEELRLLITGKMGSGKGWAANHLALGYGAVRWSRTELMKRLAHAIADHIDDPDPILVRLFPDFDERNALRTDLLAYLEEYRPEPGKPRRLYQDVTEICQEYDPLCFERELASRIASARADGFSLIDDVRSLAAFDYFSAQGYRSLRIEASEEIRRERMLARDGYLPSEETFNHPSETELDEVPHDFVIHNDSSPAHFEAELDEMMSTLGAASLAR